MTRFYEWWIGTRYLSSTHRRGFVSIVALISVIGLMLGVAVLIVVLSVMNGFERELRTRILAVTAHATLMGLEGTLDDWREARAVALGTEGVRAAVPYVEAQSMLAHGSVITGAQVRGIDPDEEGKADGLESRMTSGSLGALFPGSWNIVLGDALAAELGAQAGDTLVLIAPEGSATPTGVMPRMRRFTVSGIFSSGMYEFDRGLALVNLQDAARLYRTGDGVTGLRLELDDAFAAPRIVREVALGLGGGFYVSDWTRNHANFFRSIEITKSLMFVILLMIVGVAAFNIVATLVMIVKEKQTDIAILRTLGAGPRNVLGAFTVQGVLIGLAGTALGAGLGMLVARNLESLVRSLERALGTQFLDARVYYMSDLPAYVEWQDVLQVCGVAFALCALATLYPAWRAARTAPAEALRHE
ncbi:MAG TPA: lipoprotein-releasing ABC transporter permease subunit [Steroidobacteraceae bacterium]|nr:lipoprotein-releasing ABC transporter permease subunit [Steroidobacteraceae bacterium]HNS27530.1 lipoprotein-releasing ABC transporter permease subunit [Steroidobacteraceae bacterium]